MLKRIFLGPLIIFVTLLIGAWAFAQDIKVYANREIKPEILELISQARNSIDIQMYTFTDQDVIRALQRAKMRGVEVRVVLDPNQPSNAKNMPQLINRGVEVKWYPIEKPGIMHRKVAVFDKRYVLIGSANWTHNAFTGSVEIDLLVDDPQLAERIEEIFASDWLVSYAE